MGIFLKGGQKKCMSFLYFAEACPMHSFARSVLASVISTNMSIFRSPVYFQKYYNFDNYKAILFCPPPCSICTAPNCLWTWNSEWPFPRTIYSCHLQPSPCVRGAISGKKSTHQPGKRGKGRESLTRCLFSVLHPTRLNTNEITELIMFVISTFPRLIMYNEETHF